MVTTPSPSTRTHSRHLWRLIVLVALLLAAVAGPAAVASAQDDTGGTYGFNDACEQLHDSLDGVGVGPFNLGNYAGAWCKAGNVVTHPGDAVEAIKDKAWDSTFGKAVDSMLTGLGQAITLALTFWTKVPNSAVDDLPGLMTKVRDYTDTVQLYILAGSLIFCGVRLASARSSAVSEEASESFKVPFRTVMALAVWPAMIVIATRVSDAFSAWVIEDSSGGNAKGIAETAIMTEALTAFSPGLIIVFAVVGLLSAILQFILAIVRQGMLVLVVGMLPLAAAASGARSGQQFYQKLLLWSVAFVLYKPVAAIAYMIAFTIAGSNTIDSNTQPDAATAVRALVAVALLCSVAFVLPAIMRLLSPVATMGGGVSGAAMAGAVVGGGSAAGMFGRMASGAADSRGGGTVSNHGSGGSNRPSGAATVATSAGQQGSAGAAGAAGKSAAAGGAAGGGAAGAGAAGAGAAGGPYGAAAMAAVKGAGAAVRAGDQAVNQAVDSGSSPPSTPPPSGAGSSKAVPR